MNLEPTNGNPVPDPDAKQINEARWIRIASGLELLERMAHAESDAEKKEALLNALAEAKCI